MTGAASGIGFALSRTFAETGMKVMLADIETDARPQPSRTCTTLGRMCAELDVMLPILPA